MGLQQIGGSTGGGEGDPIAFPDQPFVVWVTTEGDDGTGEIGNPLLPFATAQAAAAAIDAGPGGNYTMRLGAGNFGSITWTSAISSKLRHIFGEGHHLSTLAGIDASGANGADGTGSSINGGTGFAGLDITLSGDNTVTISAIDSNGGSGGAGAVSDDIENGGNGGSGGTAGLVLLKGFHIGAITANGGPGGGAATGNSYSGNGGDGGSINVVELIDCTFDTLTQTPGDGGPGNVNGNTGAATAQMRIAWCKYATISNPSDQGMNPQAVIAYCLCSSTAGNASISEIVNIA